MIPLSPGGNMYNACYALIMNNLDMAITETMKCIKIVGMCVIAILIVLSLPEGIFKNRDKAKA